MILDVKIYKKNLTWEKEKKIKAALTCSHIL